MQEFTYREEGAEVTVRINGKVSYYQVKCTGFISSFDLFNSKLLGNFTLINQ